MAESIGPGIKQIVAAAILSLIAVVATGDALTLLIAAKP